MIYEKWSGAGTLRKAERFVATKRNAAVAVICLLVFVLAALLYFFVLPWAGDKAAALIPPEVEIELGRSLSARFIEGDAPLPVADSLLNAFAGKLDLETEYPVKLHLIDSPEINAFALPGGNIFVYSGILCQMSSYEQLAALVGHEVSHVNRRHSLKSICRSAASSFLIAALFGDMSGISSGILSQADQFRQLEYSRELETEADLESLRLLRANSIDENGMLELLKVLEREGARAPRLMKYLSTHPDTEERINTVMRNAMPATTPAADPDLRTLFEELRKEID